MISFTVSLAHRRSIPLVVPTVDYCHRVGSCTASKRARTKSLCLMGVLIAVNSPLSFQMATGACSTWNPFLESVKYLVSCSVAKLCLTLYDPMNCSTPVFPVSLLKLMSVESVMPSNHLILLCPFSSCPQSFQHKGLFQ